ncbi:lipoprotein insertase outer membrane protein LolB [Pseudomonas sp. OIL-1]|uniref:lipoprotein insertase outer membrane protein LolB n=1 Tax=Pseudomonas sp. OIL-1 TaxID=2706126 RepID=UPI0013A75C99|nr:lipoprotein insertase outer membrane protein LolB [Pseudomonas sp. OIL-1]QIB50882.1 outer membrane lipoprotein LolB [Pseudomonas sp. OIL-1]
MNPFIRVATLVCVAVALSACGNLHKRETLEFGGDAAAWKAHRQSVEPIVSWTLQGKLGMRSPEQSGSGTLLWLQQRESYDIRLSGPLGRGATQIVGTPAGVTLEIAGREPMHAATAEDLLEEQIGWRLPVEHLLWWVRGLPAPDSPSRLQLDIESRLARLQQSGWTIEYSRYQDVDGIELPQRMQLAGHDILLTLIITQWDPELSE